MGTAHQARSSDRSSPLRLRRHLSPRRLHHRAEGDSENLDSSRKKKKRLALATRALVTDFRPRHLSEYPDTRTAGVPFHTHPPGGRHSSTAFPCLLEFCYPHQDSIRLHSPIPVGKFRADRGRTRMNFPILARDRSSGSKTREHQADRDCVRRESGVARRLSISPDC